PLPDLQLGSPPGIRVTECARNSRCMMARVGWALLGGLCGAAAMSGLMMVLRLMRADVDVEMVFGTLFGLPIGDEAFLVGLAVLLGLGALFSLIYVPIFDRVLHRADWRAGASIGFLQAFLAGFAAGFLPLVHPLMPDQIRPPGFFFVSLGPMAILGNFFF